MGPDYAWAESKDEYDGVYDDDDDVHDYDDDDDIEGNEFTTCGDEHYDDDNDDFDDHADDDDDGDECFCGRCSCFRHLEVRSSSSSSSRSLF